MKCKESARRFTVLCIAEVSVLLMSSACDDDKKPSYKELQAQNEELEGRLSQVKEDISNAKSQLDDLRSEINSLPDCEDDTRLYSDADDVESTLDTADEDAD